MKITKRITSIISLVSIAFLMTACGSTPKQTDDIAATVANTEIQEAEDVENVEDIDQNIAEEETLGASSSGRGH